MKSPGLIETSKILFHRYHSRTALFLPGEAFRLFAAFLDKILVHPIVLFVHIVVNRRPVQVHHRSLGQIHLSIPFQGNQFPEYCVEFRTDTRILYSQDSILFCDLQLLLRYSYFQFILSDPKIKLLHGNLVSRRRIVCLIFLTDADPQIVVRIFLHRKDSQWDFHLLRLVRKSG